ncbi:MAG: V-type ATP synthase subunit E family protein [Methanobacteriaceae archaeon]|jgi:V/A-type H+-transporting ATPase subunit E
MSSGTEKIVESISSDSHGKVAEIINKAKEDAEKIINKGKMNAQKKQKEILDSARRDAEIKFQQIMSDAKLNSRKSILTAREELMKETFRRAEEELRKIASAKSEKYTSSLLKLIKEASLEIGGGSLEIFLKNGDFDKIDKSLKTIENEVSEEIGNETTLKFGNTINTIGGVIVKTENGNIEVNNTIEARMERFKGSLRLKVARILFE